MTTTLEAPSTLGRESEPRLEEALVRAGRLVSGRTGIISTVWFVDLAVEEPAVYWALAEPSNAAALTGQPTLHRGGGASVDPRRAIMKAVGESVERYCAGLYDERAFRLATARELGGQAVEPGAFTLFSPEQHAQPDFPYTPFTPDTPLRWVEGRSLGTGRPVYVPAQFVYVPYPVDAPREACVVAPISTGLACGPDLAWATYRGLLEVVERDAYTVVWQNRLPRPAIDLAGARDPLVRALLGAIERVPIRCRAILLTIDIPVPVVMVVLETDPACPPFVVVGLGADLDPARALVRALEEAYLCLCGLSRAVAALEGRGAGPDELRALADEGHGFAHTVDPALRSTVEFLTATEDTVSLEELGAGAAGHPAASLETLVDRLGARGFEAVAVDLTTPDVDDVGFKVVRALVPALQPLDHDPAYPHLGGPRLDGAPRRLGLPESQFGSGRYNPDRHPLT